MAYSKIQAQKCWEGNTIADFDVVHRGKNRTVLCNKASAKAPQRSDGGNRDKDSMCVRGRVGYSPLGSKEFIHAFTHSTQYLFSIYYEP